MEKLVRATPQELVATVAEQLCEIARDSIAARGQFSLVLAGGSTPRALYQLLATPEWQNRINWHKALVFFGDERAVPPDDERSNYKMAREALLQHIPIPAANIYRMQGEAQDLEAASRAYENSLHALHVPLDLVLLGMGEDGHTASLFPQTPALDEPARWCVATDVAPMEPPVRRLTLTYPVINAAHNIFIIVTGAAKADRVAQALGEDADFHQTPVSGVQPQQGRLVWMLDEPAARK